MSSSGVGYTCKKCGRTIPISEGGIHELNCKPNQNLTINCIFNDNSFRNNTDKNKITSKTLENNKKMQVKNNNALTCDICGTKLNIEEKGDHLLCHNLQNNENVNTIDFNNQINSNTIIAINNNNTTTQNEEALNFNGIENARNIEGNFINQVIVGENDNFITQNNVNLNNEDRFSYNSFNYHPVDKTIIKAFFTNEIKDISNEFAKEPCRICLETFKKGDKWIALPCIHHFHSKCIIKWMNEKNTCPICNFKITSSNINNIENLK